MYHTGDKNSTPPGMNFRVDFLHNQGRGGGGAGGGEGMSRTAVVVCDTTESSSERLWEEDVVETFCIERCVESLGWRFFTLFALSRYFVLGGGGSPGWSTVLKMQGCERLLLLLRGTMVNRTCGANKTL